MGSIVTSIDEGIAGIGDWISGLGNSILDGLLINFDDLSSWITNLGTNIGDWFGELGTDIGAWFGSLGDNLGQWLSYLNPSNENFFGIGLISMLSDTLSYLFEPSADITSGLSSVVSSKFGFIDTISNFITQIQDMLENLENGSSELTLDIESEYFEGEVTVFDLSWYAPFKAYGDMVFTGFAYVLFFFRLWKQIPNILSGISSGVDSISKGGGVD